MDKVTKQKNPKRQAARRKSHEKYMSKLKEDILKNVGNGSTNGGSGVPILPTILPALLPILPTILPALLPILPAIVPALLPILPTIEPALPAAVLIFHIFMG